MKPFFYFIQACSCGKYTEDRDDISRPNYLAGEYLFCGNPYSLIAIASTEVWLESSYVEFFKYWDANGLDGKPGVAGVDDDGINGIDDIGERGKYGDDLDTGKDGILNTDDAGEGNGNKDD